MKKLIITAAAALITAGSLLADNLKETTFTLNPRMTCANCEKKIKSNLRFEKGVKEITTSIPDQEVKVVYNPEKASEASLQAAFKKIGYSAVATATTDAPSKAAKKSKKSK